MDTIPEQGEQQPTYMQLAARLRSRITDGLLTPGQRLPSVRELAAQEGVAPGTVGRAIGQLQVEGRVVTSTRGTFVNDAPETAPSSAERLARIQRTGSLLGEGESLRVTSAELVRPPVYVADIFDLEPGDQVVRREWVTGKGQQRLGLFVTWYPAHFAASVPELLSTAPSKAPGLLMKVQAAVGRRGVAGRAALHSRASDAREASHLGQKTGAPVLAGAQRLWDETGVIEYSEWCLPDRLVVGYEFTV